MERLERIFCNSSVGPGLIQAYLISAAICLSLGCIFFIVSAFMTSFVISGAVFCGLAAIIMCVYVTHAACLYRIEGDVIKKTQMVEEKERGVKKENPKLTAFRNELNLLREDVCKLPNRPISDCSETPDEYEKMRDEYVRLKNMAESNKKVSGFKLAAAKSDLDILKSRVHETLYPDDVTVTSTTPTSFPQQYYDVDEQENQEPEFHESKPYADEVPQPVPSNFAHRTYRNDSEGDYDNVFVPIKGSNQAFPPDSYGNRPSPQDQRLYPEDETDIGDPNFYSGPSSSRHTAKLQHFPKQLHVQQQQREFIYERNEGIHGVGYQGQPHYGQGYQQPGVSSDRDVLNKRYDGPTQEDIMIDSSRAGLEPSYRQNIHEDGRGTDSPASLYLMHYARAQGKNSSVA